MKGGKMKKELELYVHIPFCVRKCAYCDFLSSPGSEETVEEYVGVLIKEIQNYKEFARDYMVTTIFFGGGTPSILEGCQIGAIMKALKEVFEIEKDAEISIEANPGTVTIEKLTAYKQSGINRISFGLQSVNNEELKLLGRIHTFEEFLESYRLARKAGFDNINVDLISAIPKQTLKSWEETLNAIVELKPEHISAYSLIIEEGTPFAEIYGEGGIKEHELPDEEEERRIYKMTEEWLLEAGYHRYEISNYAKEGRECRHNLGYWERKNYLGIGLGAASLVENVRYHNIVDLKKYMECAGKLEEIHTEKENLTMKEQQEEFIFLGLRKSKGISKAEFQKYFGKEIYGCYGDSIRKLIKKELLEENAGNIRLTKRGIDISNYVFVELLYE